MANRVTNAALAARLDAVQKLLENELRHQAGDIEDLKQWRDAFMAENGPWRRLDKRVEKLERLAWLFGGGAALLLPVTVWAIIEIIETFL